MSLNIYTVKHTIKFRHQFPAIGAMGVVSDVETTVIAISSAHALKEVKRFYKLDINYEFLEHLGTETALGVIIKRKKVP